MKRGFTLVELLAVIVVLAVIIAIVVPTVNNLLIDSKRSLSKVQIKNIENAAKQYYLSEGNNANTCVDLSYLIENKYLNGEEIIDPDKKETILGSVKITNDGTKYSYEYQEESCSICTVVEGSGNSIGDKLECEVKPATKYNFYILSRNEDETLNLIMERNIYYNKLSDIGQPDTGIPYREGITEWVSKEFLEENAPQTDYDDWKNLDIYGPVTAMQYVHNATKDWINVSNIIMDYEDENIDKTTGKSGENGYGGIKTEGNKTRIIDAFGNITVEIENLKARLPEYNELKNNGCEHRNADEGVESCPLWLVNYLDFDVSDGHYLLEEHPYGFYSSEAGRVIIDDIWAYWILSSGVYGSKVAWYVDATGSLDCGSLGVVAAGGVGGVRPVITISKDDIKSTKSA